MTATTKLQRVKEWKRGECSNVSPLRRWREQRMWVPERMSEYRCRCFFGVLDSNYLNVFMLMERNGEGEAKDETGWLMNGVLEMSAGGETALGWETALLITRRRGKQQRWRCRKVLTIWWQKVEVHSVWWLFFALWNRSVAQLGGWGGVGELVGEPWDKVLVQDLPAFPKEKEKSLV